MRKLHIETPKSFFSSEWHKHPFAIPVITFLVLFVLSCMSFIFFNSEEIGANDSKVVHLYVDGNEKILPTRAQTVGDVLKLADIELNEGDIAEPALDNAIVDQDFNINVYRAKPVTVIDEKGGKVTTKVAESQPEAIAKKAGFKLYPEDDVELAEADDALKDGVIGAKVVIDRATPAYINLYGNIVIARTHAATVGDLLKEKGIKAVSGDSVLPAAETPLTDNIQIFVTQVGKQLATVEEVIPAPVEKVNDPNVLTGTQTVREEGAPGKKIVTYDILIENGKEKSRTPIQEVIAEVPVKKVIAVGTKVVISNPSANVQLGEQMAAARGWTGGEWYCLYQLWQRESGWRTNAGNPSSGAYGIPQALPGSKMGTGWQTDPAVQINWGFGYIVGRYKTPCGAWQAFNSRSPHWY